MMARPVRSTAYADWLPAAYHLIDSARLAYFARSLSGSWCSESPTEFHHWPVDPISNAPLAPTIDPEDPYECGLPDLVQ
jgi:hypothetical protein